jgi:hypothetical protein
MAVSLTDLAAEIAALRALVRGLLSLSFAGEDLEKTKSALLRQNLGAILEADLPDITQREEVLTKARTLAHQLIEDARSASR